MTDAGASQVRPTQPVTVPPPSTSSSSSSSSSFRSLQRHAEALTAQTSVFSVFGEDHPYDELLNEVDVSIRVAFVQFLFDPELLGHVDQHLCIYRLFPRPVVALRNSAFLAAYKSSLGTTDVQFIQELIKTQVCVGVWVGVVSL